MDIRSKAYFLKSFEVEFLKKKEKEFQNFFSDIMEKRYSADFTRVRPWGKKGDRKNDGYLKSKRFLFQIYAPNEIRENATLNKINEDFNGALPYWKQYFDTWIFTHNSQGGLSGDVLNKILELGKENSPKTACWGFEELKREVMSLNEENLKSLFGPFPSDNDLLNLSFSELEEVIKFVSKKQCSTGEILPVSKEKLQYNNLSDEAEILLLAGMKKSKLVEEYFNSCSNPLLGDEIASYFNKEYKRMKEQNLSPDIIFNNLWELAGKGQVASAKHEAAVLAILAHFFTFCDIFDNPPKK